MLFCWGKKGLLGLWLKGEKSEHPCFYGVLPVDAHISLSPKGLEAGQKADRRISLRVNFRHPRRFPTGASVLAVLSRALSAFILWIRVGVSAVLVSA
jgi:hypothetical protein